MFVRIEWSVVTRSRRRVHATLHSLTPLSRTTSFGEKLGLLARGWRDEASGSRGGRLFRLNEQDVAARF